MYEIDEIVRNEAFYIPFWSAPYVRLAYWHYLAWPDFYLPMRTQAITDYLVAWIDPDKREELEAAMAVSEALPTEDLDQDPYGILEEIQ